MRGPSRQIKSRVRAWERGEPRSTFTQKNLFFTNFHKKLLCRKSGGPGFNGSLAEFEPSLHQYRNQSPSN